MIKHKMTGALNKLYGDKKGESFRENNEFILAFDHLIHDLEECGFLVISSRPLDNFHACIRLDAIIDGEPISVMLNASRIYASIVISADVYTGIGDIVQSLFGKTYFQYSVYTDKVGYNFHKLHGYIDNARSIGQIYRSIVE